MREMTLSIVFGALFAIALIAIFTKIEQGLTASACKDKVTVERALKVCATSQSCVITLTEVERLLSLAEQCEKR